MIVVKKNLNRLGRCRSYVYLLFLSRRPPRYNTTNFDPIILSLFTNKVKKKKDNQKHLSD